MNQEKIKSISPDDYNNPDLWPDPDTANKVMAKVFEHFQKHHLVVGKKLDHARVATAQSLQDMKVVYKKLRLDQDSKEFKDVSKFDQLWDEIIQEFQNSGISEAELEQIDLILHAIPETIKRYYDILLEQDKILQSLLTELQAPEFSNALAMTKKIQSRPCQLSGLSPSAFDLAADQGNKTSARGTIYRNVSRNKDTAH